MTPAPVAVDPDDADAARDTALHIIVAAAQSRVALHRKLTRRGFSAAAAEAAVAAVATWGYLDEEALALSVARRRLRSGHGTRFIRRDLQQRSLPATAVLAAVDAIDEHEEAAVAVAVAMTVRFTARQVAEPALARARVERTLQARGFGPAARRAAVDAYLDAARSGFPPVR